MEERVLELEKSQEVMIIAQVAEEYLMGLEKIVHEQNVIKLGENVDKLREERELAVQ